MRTVYAVNAHGRYMAREELRKNGAARCWVEVSRVYEHEMVLGFPTEVCFD
jgi:hypothetical protein